jgi:hypothetical protein
MHRFEGRFATISRVKLSLYEAVEAHTILRRRGSQIL